MIDSILNLDSKDIHNMYAYVVTLKGKPHGGFFEKQPALFSKSRMCTRVGAFESPMSQLSQAFFL